MTSLLCAYCFFFLCVCAYCLHSWALFFFHWHMCLHRAFTYAPFVILCVCVCVCVHVRCFLCFGCSQNFHVLVSGFIIGLLSCLGGGTYLCYTISYSQEKRLRMNMGLKKLQERVKKQQEEVGKKVTTLIRKYPISY